MRFLIGTVLLGAASVSCLQAQTAANVEVRWEPQHPSQGSFVYLYVRPDIRIEPEAWTGRITASLAGQELHFERGRTGEFVALAAIPVNAQETIPVTLALARGRDSVHRFVRIPIGPGDFDSERLSVAPRFSRQPDSALQARIRAESRRSREVSIRTHSTPRMWHGEWVLPRPSEITSAFGTGRVFNGEIQSRHMGLDLDGDTGDPIRAANRGTVALVGDFYYAGNVVYLDHGAGLITIYMHMSEVEVQEGDIVQPGQVIGRVGATGRVTGPHLHWVGRYGRISVNPLTIFDLDSSVLGPPADGTNPSPAH